MPQPLYWNPPPVQRQLGPLEEAQLQQAYALQRMREQQQFEAQQATQRQLWGLGAGMLEANIRQQQELEQMQRRQELTEGLDKSKFELDKQLDEHKYVAGQKRLKDEIERNMADLEELKMRGGIDDSVYEQMRQSLVIKRMGIDKLVDPPQPSLDDTLQQRMKTNPDGSTVILQPDGKIDWKPPPKAAAETQQTEDLMKMYFQVEQAMRGPAGDIDPDPTDVWKKIGKIRQASKEMQAGITPEMKEQSGAMADFYAYETQQPQTSQPARRPYAAALGAGAKQTQTPYAEAAAKVKDPEIEGQINEARKRGHGNDQIRAILIQEGIDPGLYGL